MHSHPRYAIFRWVILTTVIIGCVDALIRYWTPAGLPIIIINIITPPILYFITRSDTVNRLGMILLGAPVLMILEMVYLNVRGLSFPGLTAINHLVILVTLNLAFFSLFGAHFTGWMKRHINLYPFSLLLVTIAASILIYKNYRYDIYPYVVLLFIQTGIYLIIVTQIRAHERMIAEQEHTIMNTRTMMRSIVHDISNFIAAASGWSDMAFKAASDEKRIINQEKAEFSFNRAIDHINTVTAILCDQQNIVNLSLVTPGEFCSELHMQLKNSFVGTVSLVKGRPPELTPGCLTIAIPAVLNGKRLYADLQKFSCAILNLVANAKHAGATAMALQIEEAGDPAGLLIRFIDNGRGIPRSKAGLLFQERVPSDSGSGVGLLGVRMIINCHNASIAVENANSDGKGLTQFVISNLSYCAD